MKVFMTGGTGFFGSALTEKLLAEGHSVTILTRSDKKRDIRLGLAYCVGSPTKGGAWQEEAARHDVIINLAGASIFRIWNEKNKKAIHDSRIQTTRNIVKAMSRAGKKMTLLNASAVGYYGFRGDEELDEKSSPGDDFLANVVKDWEAEAKKAEEFDTRVVFCRFGIILGKDGGALVKMLPAFKWGLGSRLGSGSQWFSWIALPDLINIILYLMTNETISGPVNCTSPQPVTNREMTRALGRTLHRPVFLPPVPAFVIKGVLGEFGDVFIKGQRVLPKKLLASGFVFDFPEIERTLAHLV